MKRHLAALAGLVLGLAACLTVIVGVAAPANASISFCQTAKNSPCISPINGCSLTLGGGKYAFAQSGDTIIDGSGAKFVCVNGRWIKTAALGVPPVQLGPNIGRGVVAQGKPIGDIGCNPEQLFCP
jgi:hypothetical protein